MSFFRSRIISVRGVELIASVITYHSKKVSILNKLISKPVRKSSCGLPFKIKSLAIPSGATSSKFSSKTDLGVCLRDDSPARNYRTGWNYFFKNMHLLQYNTIKGKIYCCLCFGIVAVLSGLGVKIM